MLTRVVFKKTSTDRCRLFCVQKTVGTFPDFFCIDTFKVICTFGANPDWYQHRRVFFCLYFKHII